MQRSLFVVKYFRYLRTSRSMCVYFSHVLSQQDGRGLRRGGYGGYDGGGE